MKLNVTFFVIILLIPEGCQSTKKSSSIDFRLNGLPPGTKEVADNFYCDKDEISNVGWREYMYWTKRVFGRESEEYKSIQPDTLVWTEFATCLAALSTYYLRDPEYAQHPVVGISQQQAIEYSKWRSDRVFEVYLSDAGILKYNTVQTKENHFTIERYLNGEIKKVIPDKRITYYPEYRLPTSEEREFIIKYSDLIDRHFLDSCNSVDCEECKTLYPFIWSDIIPCESDSLIMIPTIQRFKCIPEKENPIHNIRGNVREWISDKNMAAGGAWLDKREEIIKADVPVLTQPNALTGFRNVCEWKNLKE